MREIYPSDWPGYIQILLVFLRAMGLLLLVPGLSHGALPRSFKLLFCLSLALVIYPIVKPHLPEISNNLGQIVILALRETFIGLVMGFVAYLLSEGTSLASQFVGYQMGFGTAGLLEPQSQSSVSIVVHLKIWIVLVLFFITNTHHHVIQLFVESFALTRNLDYSFGVNKATLDIIVTTAGKMFVMAVQLAAPIMFLMLVSNFTLAIVARLLPQMNILLFSFPVTILVGFIGLYVITPDLVQILENILGEMTGSMLQIIKAL